MIDFQSEFKQHLSTILPIYTRLKELKYEVRLQGVIASKDADLSISSYDNIITKNPGYKRYIMHHHGLEPTKKAYPKEPIGHRLYQAQIGVELHLLASDWWKEKFMELRFPEDNLRVLGYPKLDPLFTSFRELEVQARSEIKTELPILLYAPTWFGERINSSKTYDTLTDIAQKRDYMLLVKEHETSNSIFKGPRKNVFFLDKHENIVPYYTITDVLITDVSSSAYEIACVDKPIIQVTEKLQAHYLTDISLHSSLEDLEKNIERSLNNPKELSSNRHKWAKRVMILDGNSTDRACQEILKCLER